MTMPGMWGLFCTVRLIHSRIGDPDKQSDLMFPLLQEMMGYQILSAWPKCSRSTPTIPVDFASQQLRRAIDYIEGHLFRPMTLADVAAAANTGVRSLQSKFKSELGVTPLQYIISRRLARAHEDLLSRKEISLSINEIARKWGFVHMSDFGKRYRKQYGCTPRKRGARSIDGQEAFAPYFRLIFWVRHKCRRQPSTRLARVENRTSACGSKAKAQLPTRRRRSGSLLSIRSKPFSRL